MCRGSVTGSPPYTRIGMGKSPLAARTYIAGEDVVVVVLEESLTPAEQAVVDRGEAGVDPGDSPSFASGDGG